MTCELCGQREAVAQQCPGDLADHRHGRIHTRDGGLVAVCLPCGRNAAREWGRLMDDNGRYMRRQPGDMTESQLVRAWQPLEQSHE